MTICSTDFSPHCPPFNPQLKPTSHSHHISFVTCRNPYPNDGYNSRSSPKVGVSAETRPTRLQASDCRKAHLMKLINRSCKTGKFNESLYFLECLVNKGYTPNVILCTKLVKGFFKFKSIEKASRVMGILESYAEPDVFAYNALISGYCKMNRFEAATRVLNRMKARGFLPDIVTYNIMIWSLCNKRKLRLALKFLDQLLEDNCLPTVITYTILIEATIEEGGINKSMKLLEEMLARGLLPDMYTYNAIIRGMCREGMVERAAELIKSLASKAASLMSSHTISYCVLS